MNPSLKAAKGWHSNIYDDTGEVWCQEPMGGYQESTCTWSLQASDSLGWLSCCPLCVLFFPGLQETDGWRFCVFFLFASLKPRLSSEIHPSTLLSECQILDFLCKLLGPRLLALWALCIKMIVIKCSLSSCFELPEKHWGFFNV